MKNETKKTIYLIITIFLMVSVFFGAASYTRAVTPIPFGGRILFFSPLFVTGEVNCPSLVAVENIGGPYKGLIYLLLPPTLPRAYYNYYSPGVSVLGTFLPTPIPINCPFQPLFPSLYFGTSAR